MIKNKRVFLNLVKYNFFGNFSINGRKFYQRWSSLEYHLPPSIPTLEFLRDRLSPLRSFLYIYQRPSKLALQSGTLLRR